MNLSIMTLIHVTDLCQSKSIIDLIHNIIYSTTAFVLTRTFPIFHYFLLYIIGSGNLTYKASKMCTSTIISVFTSLQKNYAGMHKFERGCLCILYIAKSIC